MSILRLILDDVGDGSNVSHGSREHSNFAVLHRKEQLVHLPWDHEEIQPKAKQIKNAYLE